MQDWIGALVDSPPISWQMAGCKRGHYEGPEYCERCGQDIPREFVCDEWDEAKRAVHQK